MVPPNNLGPDLNGKAVNETQYRANPKESHLIVVERIFRKSTSSSCQLLGGKLVCWSAKKQQSMAMSSAEAEYVVAIGCCANILWMKSQLTDYDIIYEKVPVFCDNTSAIAILNNPVLHSKTKHIDIRYHFISDHILKGDIELHFIPTQYRLADIFTKPLDEPTFKRLIVELGNGFQQLGIERKSLPKGTLKKSFLPPRFLSLLIQQKMKEQDYGDGDVTINPTEISMWCLKLPKPPLKAKKKDSKGKKPGAKTGSSKIQSGSKSKETKDGSSKVPNRSQSGHFKTVSSSALDTNPSQPPASTPVDAGMHKEDKQPTCNPTSLGVISEDGAHPQLSSGRDALADSTAKVDPRKSAPHDSIPQQQGRDEGTKNYTLNHIFTGTDPNVLAKKTKSISEGLEIDLATPEIEKGAGTITKQIPKDDPIIVVDESEEEEDKDEGIHANSNVETKDTSVPKPPSPRTSKYNEDLSWSTSFKTRRTQKTSSALEGFIFVVIVLDRNIRKLELEKNKDKAEVALLSAQPSFSDVTQLTELLVKSLKPEFLKILSAYDFSSSLPTKLKELPSKFTELTEEVKGLKKHVHELEIELPGDLKDIPPKLEEFTKTLTSAIQVETVLAKLKTLDALPSLLNKVTEALNHLAQAIASTKDASVLFACQAGTQPAEGEKNINQATISYPPKSSSQTEGEHIKKAKKDMSSKDDEEGSDSESNDIVNLTGSKVESLRKKELKKFDFVTKDGDHIHLTEEQIKEQNKIEESTKAEAAKHEVEVRKEELVDLLGPDVVSKYYKAKLQYDNYCDKMLNKRAKSRIINYDVLTRKGLITLKVYREDGTSEFIPNFKAGDLHLGE
ncbi:hypothetical protein Tco_0627805 [Tanacetum coccineum]|uniref:Retrovirus-related Pol polyprotein from transposon TNT 1-94 n=1 Tax=Tanacetum coccineum TaxID=301880 RepID=A0ABQ4WNQ1_9ASTR